MKETVFKKPELEVIEINNDDIIRTSGVDERDINFPVLGNPGTGSWTI